MRKNKLYAIGLGIRTCIPLYPVICRNGGAASRTGSAVRNGGFSGNTGAVGDRSTVRIRITSRDRSTARNRCSEGIRDAVRTADRGTRTGNVRNRRGNDLPYRGSPKGLFPDWSRDGNAFWRQFVTVVHPGIYIYDSGKSCCAGSRKIFL